MKDVNSPRFFDDIVEYALVSEHDFPQGSPGSSGIARSNKGELGEETTVFQDSTAHSQRCVGIITRNALADAVNVCNRRIGPNYFVAHLLAHDSSTCSASS
jgi:hypothetical protein